MEIYTNRNRGVLDVFGVESKLRPTRRRRRAALALLAATMTTAIGGGAAEAANQSWSGGVSGTNTAWYTPTNWTGGAFPGLQGVAVSNTDIATIAAGTNTTFGINMGTASLNLGAIDYSRPIAANIGDSSATAGSLRLYGATVNGVANTMLRNSGTGLVTLQAAQNGVMTVVLSNTTANLINIDNSGGITISANLTEVGGARNLTLNANSSGVLTLSGPANAYTGGTTIGAGTLSVSSGSAIGNGPLTLSQTAGKNTAITFNNAAQTITTLSSAFTDTTGTQTQTVTLNGTALTINQAANSTFGAGAVATLTSTITGSGSVLKQGAGSLTLTGNQTYAGTTGITAGKLFVNGHFTSATNAVTVSGTGTLGGSGDGASTGLIAGAVAINSGGAIAPGAAANNVGKLTTGATTFGNGGNYNWNILHAGGAAGTDWSHVSVASMDLSGLGVASFNLNLFSLSSAGTQGSLSPAFNAALPQSWSIMTSGTTISGFASNSFTINSAGFLGIASGTFSVGLGNSDLDLVLNFTPTSVLAWSGGNGQWAAGSATWNSVVDNDTAWDNTVHAGVEATFAAVNTVSVAAGGVTTGKLKFNAGATISNSDGGTVTLTNGTITVSNAVDTATVAAPIAGSAGVTKAGPGTLILSGANTFGGGVTINDGAVQLGQSGALNGNSVTFGPGAAVGTKLGLGGNSVTVASLSTNATPGSPAVENASATPATLTVDGVAVTVYAGALQDGAGGGALSVTKSGTGTLTLSGTNTYSGSTAISGGEVILGGAAAMPSTTALSMSGTGKLSLGGNAATISDLSGAATTIVQNGGVGGAMLTVNKTSGASTFNGVIQNGGAGALGITKSGLGELALGGASTYSGATNVTAGTLRATTNAALGNSAVTVTGGNMLAAAGVTVGNAITVSNVGSGLPSLLAGWDFQTTASGGTAAAAAPSSPTLFTANFGTGSIHFNGTHGASTWVTATSGNELTAFAGTSVNTTGTSFSTTTTSPASMGLVGGTGGTANGKAAVFLVDMTGKQDLNITYATQGTATGFTSQAWSFSTDGINWTPAQTITGTNAIASFATQTLTTISGLANQPAAYVRLVVTGATGGTGNNRFDNIQFVATPYNGVLGSDINSGNATFSGDVTLNRNVSLTSAAGGAAVFSGVIKNGAAPSGITKIGAGQVDLTNANTYSGATSVSAGILQIASTGTINTTSALNIAGGQFKYNSATPYSGGNIALTSGTISGSGTIGNSVSGGAGTFLAPGNGVGTQTFTAGINFSGGLTYTWELGAYKAIDAAPNPAGAAGTDWDLINLTGGTLVLGGASTIDLTFLGISNLNDTAAGNAFWNFPHTWKVIDTLGAASTIGAGFANIQHPATSSGNFGQSIVDGDVFITYTPSIVDTSLFSASPDPLPMTSLLLNAPAASATIATTLHNTGGTSGNYSILGSGLSPVSGGGPAYIAASGTANLTLAAITSAYNSAPAFTIHNNIRNLDDAVVTVTGTIGNATAADNANPATVGQALHATIAPGGSYANLASRLTDTSGSGGAGQLGVLESLGPIETTATILAGTNSSLDTQDVAMAWRTRTTAETGFVVSDVVDVSGVTGIYVLQMTYSPDVAALVGQGQTSLFIGWRNDHGGWENAVLGNSDHTPGTLYLMSWTAAGSTLNLGDFGVDDFNHVVWAVLDHNSQFAVIPAPLALPTGLSLLCLATLRRPRRA